MINPSKISVCNLIAIVFFFFIHTNIFGQSSSTVYCDSYAYSNSYGEIVDVSIGIWSNNSAPTIGTGYTDFTSVDSPFLSFGNTYNISIETDLPPGYTYPSFNCWVKVYIDYNNDSTYTEPDEIAFSSPIQSQDTVTGSFIVPAGSISTSTGMRVVFENTNIAADISPCGSYMWGETEDYMVMLIPQIPIDAGVISIINPNSIQIENFIYPVEVTVMNFGSDTIYNMDIEYAVNGGTPVTTYYSGLLAPSAQDNVILPDLTIPGGAFNICAYTLITGDSYTFNDGVCDSLFATPQYEAEILSINTPETGCDLAFEDVTVSFVNLGDTIDIGNLELSYGYPGINPVTEQYSNIVLPLDTVAYTFTTQIDLTVTTNSVFELLAWIDLVDDPIQTNDTSDISIWSGLTPSAPITPDITVWSGESGTLEITNLDTSLIYTWYDVDTNFIGNEFTHTTPVLLDTAHYLVESASGGTGAIAITEVGLGTNDFIEITNLTTSDFDATGYTVVISDNYSIIGSANSFQWSLGMFAGSEVQYRSDTPNENYWGTNILWNPGDAGWVVILDPYDEIVDMVIWGWTATQIANGTISISGSPIDFTSGWNGDGILVFPSVNLNRIFFDTDEATDWENVTVNSFGVFNPALFGTQTGYACESPLVPVTVFVQYHDIDVAVMNIISPITDFNLGYEDLTVDIYNNGLDSVSNFLIYYSHNGGIPVQEMIAVTLGPGDTLIYTFTQQVDLTYYGPHEICIYTDLANDSNQVNNNICDNILNLEGFDCWGAYPYLYINDPAVSGQTLLPYDSEWWKFELVGNYNDVTVSLCGSGFDTKLEVYSDCNSSYIGYNDDYCGVSSQLNFSYLSAGTYYAKVYGYGTEYGTYSLNISAALCCYYPPLIPTNVSCNGGSDGSVDLTIIPFSGMTLPLTYLWSNGQTTEDITGLPAGVYSLTVTDATGTEFIDNVTVSEPSEILVSLFGYDVSTIGGNDGWIDLWVTGGVAPYTFLWSNSETTEDLTAIYGGYYSVTVTDNNSCIVIDSVFVNTPSISQTINLLSGWNIFSTYLNPINPNINNVMIPVSANLVIVKDGDGQAYWPQYGVNLIGDLTLGEGYQLKINQTSILEIVGYYIPANQVPLNLPNGWSILGYLNQTSAPISTMLFSIQSNINIVKDGDGQVYWPSFGVNLIGNMIPGKGYQIKMSSAQSFSYPAN